MTHLSDRQCDYRVSRTREDGFQSERAAAEGLKEREREEFSPLYSLAKRSILTSLSFLPRQPRSSSLGDTFGENFTVRAVCVVMV